MLALLTTVHVLVAVFLILVVLLQSSRGTDIAGAFGGMGSQTAFGPRGTTTFLTKTTAVLAAIFMVTAITLSILSSRSRGRGGSVLSGEKAGPAKPQAAAPAPTTTPAIPAPTVQVIPPPKASSPAGIAAPRNPQPAAPQPGSAPGPPATPPSEPPSSTGATPPSESQPAAPPSP